MITHYYAVRISIEAGSVFRMPHIIDITILFLLSNIHYELADYAANTSASINLFLFHIVLIIFTDVTYYVIEMSFH